MFSREDGVVIVAVKRFSERRDAGVGNRLIINFTSFAVSHKFVDIFVKLFLETYVLFIPIKNMFSSHFLSIPEIT